MCMASLCVYSAEVQPHIFESLSMEGWKLPQHFIFPALLRSWKLLETTTSRARLLLGKVSYILLLVYEPIPQSGTINIRYNPLQFVAHASRFGARNRDVVLELPLYCGEEWPKCGLWGFPPTLVTTSTPKPDVKVCCREIFLCLILDTFWKRLPPNVKNVSYIGCKDVIRPYLVKSGIPFHYLNWFYRTFAWPMNEPFFNLHIFCEEGGGFTWVFKTDAVYYIRWCSRPTLDETVLLHSTACNPVMVFVPFCCQMPIFRRGAALEVGASSGRKIAFCPWPLWTLVQERKAINRIGMCPRWKLLIDLSSL